MKSCTKLRKYMWKLESMEKYSIGFCNLSAFFIKYVELYIIDSRLLTIKDH